MPKYRKKPVVIEALRHPEDGAWSRKLMDFIEGAGHHATYYQDYPLIHPSKTGWGFDRHDVPPSCGENHQ